MGSSGGHKRHNNSDKGERPHDASHSTKQHGHEKSNSQTSIEKTKNVSHVPCKFFRQSICQAGDKCPFSHDLDNDHPAVCKYFQKGNCKFGSKCALAHITPDGKHVNKHTREPKKKEHKDDDVSVQINSRGEGISHDSTRHEPPNSASPKTITKATVTASHVTPPNNRGAKMNASEGAGSHANEIKNAENVSVEKASVFLSKYSNANPQSPVARSYSDLAINSRRLSQIGIPENLNGLKNLRTLSHDAPISTAAVAQPASVLAPSPWSNMSKIVDGSAIADDEDDDIGLGSSNTDDEDDFCEQLVPSTLEDLLTPQERERRKSRETLKKPSRVLSSPSSKKLPLFTFRRGSAPMTESAAMFSTNAAPTMAANNINHLSSKVRSVSNSSISVNNGSNTRGSDLWSPRNLDTPFSRPPGFNSPPRNPGIIGAGTLFANGMNQTPLKYQAAPPSVPLAVGAMPTPLFKQNEAYMVSDLHLSGPNHVGSTGSSNPTGPLIDPHLPIADPLYANSFGPNYGGFDTAADVRNHPVNGLRSYAALAAEKT